MVQRIATSGEVAKALNVSPATVQWHARKQHIPFDTTPGGHRRFDIAEVQLVLAGQSGESPATSADEFEELTRELSPRPAGDLGRGVAAPTSAAARATRELRVARPEPRPDSPASSDSTPGRAHHVSALAALVSRARHAALATVHAG